MKKKVISALLASTMIVSLVACGSTGGDSSDASSKGSGTTATSTAGGDDAATAESGSGSGDSAASADWIESSTLEDDEHRQCIRFAVDHTHNRVPVIAGTGSNDTK